MKLRYLFCLLLFALSFQKAMAQKAVFISPDIYPGQATVTKMLTADKWLVLFNSSQPALTFNGGKSWILTSRIERRNIYSIFADYRDEIIHSLWAGTDSGLYKSTDMGNTWYNFGFGGQVVTHLTEQYDTLYAVTAMYTTGYPYTAKYFGRISLLTGSTTSYEIPSGYAVSRFTQTGGISYLFVQTPTEGRLLVSVNRGGTWRVTNNISSSILPFVDGFAYDKYVIKILGTTTNTQTIVFQSVDTGKTFTVFTPLQGDTNYQFANFNQMYRSGIMLGTNKACSRITFNPINNALEIEQGTASYDFTYAELLNNKALAVDYRQGIALWELNFSQGAVQQTNINFSQLNSDLTNVKLSASGRPYFLHKRGRYSTYMNNLLYSGTLYPYYDLKSLSSPDDSTLYISGAAKSLFRSIDGGNNFTYKQVAVNGEINDIHFFNSFDGLLVDNQTTIYKTSNGGDSWTIVNQSNSSYGGAFTFVNNDTGYLCSSPGLLRTTNGGQTWQQVAAVAQPSYDAFLCVGFDKTGQYGFASSGYQLFKSTNGGLNWTEQTGAPAYFQKLFVTDANIADGIAYYNGTAVFSTTNGGQVWKRKELLPLNTGAVAGTSINNFFGITGAQYIYKTDNNFSVAGLSYAKGFSGDTVMVDINADINRYSQANSLQFVLSLDTTQVRFVGFTPPTSYHAAANWTKTANFITPAKLSIAAYGTDSITGNTLVLGLKFLVQKKVGKSIPLNIESFQFNSGNDATYTLNGRIIRDSLMLGDVDINGRVQAYDAAVIARFLAGIIRVPGRKSMVQADVTNDGTISALDASIIARYVVGAITSLPNPGPTDAHGELKLAGLTNSNSRRFTVPVRLTNTANIYSLEGSISFNPAVLQLVNASWGNSAAGFIKEMKTENGKITFVCASTSPLTVEKADVLLLTFEVKTGSAEGNTEIAIEDCRLNELTGSRTGNKISVSLLSGVEGESSLPKDFALYRNYPNPFNPSTVISYDLPEQAFVNITVFDVLGREVVTLVNESKNAGRYTVSFDAAKNEKQLQAGIYLYRITAGRFTQTHKMMLLK